MKTDILIIGGGAAGLCAAIEAKRCAAQYNRALSVLVLEREKFPAKKILATGNGRCNLANQKITPDYYQGETMLAEKVYAQIPPAETLAFFLQIGIPTVNDGSGRLYPLSRRASAVADALILQAEQLGVQIQNDCTVQTITAVENGFLINGSYETKRLILAAGSPAGSKNGDMHAYQMLRELGIAVKEPYPCLCGLQLDRKYPRALKGVRQICRLSLRLGEKEIFTDTGEVQFNETGISGIPVLQSSLLASPLLQKGHRMSVLLDLLPAVGEESLYTALKNRAAQMQGFAAERLFTGYLPKPLWLYALRQCGLSPADPLPTRKKQLLPLMQHMKYAAWSVCGTAEPAQIYGGGAMASALSEQLESKKHPGLYVAGELVNVQGFCGGYNLMWAFTSGRLCGQSAAQSLA